MKISELARLIGYDYSAVSRFYHGKSNSINIELIDKICWALNVKVGELLEYVAD